MKVAYLNLLAVLLLLLLYISQEPIQAMSPQIVDEQSQTFARDREATDRDGASTEKPASEQDIQYWIEQLGSPNYADRELASEKLWQFGPKKIEQPLRDSLNSRDPETVRRAKKLLEAIEIGIGPETDRPTRILTSYFESGDTKTREQVLRALERQQNFELIFQLLEEIEDSAARKELFNSELELDTAVYYLARDEKWETIDFVLNHELAWEFDCRLAIFYARLNGTLDSKLEQLRSRISEYEEKHPVPKDQEDVRETKDESTNPKNDKEALAKKNAERQYEQDLLNTVRILRVLDRREEAFPFVKKLPSETSRVRLNHLLDLEMGNWKQVSKRLVPRSRKKPDDGKIVAQLPQIAVAQYYAGDQAEFEKTVEKLIAEIKNLEDKPKPSKTAIRKAKDTLANLLLVTFDWDRAIQWIDPDDSQNRLNLYWYSQRNEAALTRIGLTDRLEERMVWFDRANKQIQSLLKQYKRVTDGTSVRNKIVNKVGLDQLDGDAVNVKITRVFNTATNAAIYLGMLGHRDEAVFQLLTLAENIETKSPNSSTRRNMILAGLEDIGAFKEGWEFLDNRYRDSEIQNATRQLLPKKISALDYWFSRLQKIEPDVRKRARLIANLTQAPARQQGTSIDLTQIHAMVDSSLTSWTASTRNVTSYQISQTYFQQGDFEQSWRYLKNSADDGNYYSEQMISDLLQNSGEWEQGAYYYDRLWNRAISNRASTYSAIASAECLQQLNQSERAKWRRLIAYTCWLESYRTDQVLSQFESSLHQDWLVDMLNVSIHAAPGSNLSNEYYRQAFATGLRDISDVQAAIQWKISIYNRFATPLTNGMTLSMSIAASSQLHEILKLLNDGETQKALDATLMLNQYRPGDAEIAERIIPAFDQAGQSEAADELFDKVSQYYVDVLSKYPESPFYHNNYAWFCASANRNLDSATFHSEFAIHAQPHNSSYLDTLAEVNFLRGNLERARELSKQCLQIQPTKRHYQNQFLKFGGKFKFP